MISAIMSNDGLLIGICVDGEARVVARARAPVVLSAWARIVAEEWADETPGAILRMIGRAEAAFGLEGYYSNMPEVDLSACQTVIVMGSEVTE